MSTTDLELPGDGATASGSTEDPTGATDGAADPGGSQNIMSRLFSTHTPDTTPPELQRDYEVPKGLALMLYGILQMAETGGMPALGNIVLGLGLEARSRDLGGDGDDGDDDTAPEVTEVDFE